MTRSGSRDMSCDFDGLLDDLSDMDGSIVGPCDIDRELAAPSDIDCGNVHPWAPLMDGLECVDGFRLDVDPDTARRIAQPALHPGHGHYARNVKTGAKASLPGADGKVASVPAADDKLAKQVKNTSNKKEAGGKGDTLKKFQSRAFKHANKAAYDTGLSEDQVKNARKLAYKLATEQWHAQQAVPA